MRGIPRLASCRAKETPLLAPRVRGGRAMNKDFDATNSWSPFPPLWRSHWSIYNALEGQISMSASKLFPLRI
jgi:hypothetical protein